MTKRSKPSTNRQNMNFWFACPHCDWQVMKIGDNNAKLVKKMYCNHLRKTHSYTDEEVCNYIKENSERPKFYGAFLKKGVSTNLQNFMKKPDFQQDKSNFQHNGNL
tara:strand:+ start:726 stop:1043 length:318 start_codon:yes stop_codon:yes gene_type:complete